jgi:membrane dipeptidase
MKNIQRKLIVAGLLFQLTLGSASAQSSDAALMAKAKGIHDRVLKLDTHNDIDASNFTPECNYLKRLTTQVNLPKMVEGDMDVAFFIVYVGQGLPTQ